MPIGLTKRVRLDRAGRFRLGFKYQSGKRELPRATPWFHPVLKENIYMAQVLDILRPYNPHVKDWDPDSWRRKHEPDAEPIGPNVIPITIPLDDSVENGWNNIFPQWRKAYRGSTCVCIGDENTVRYRVDKKSGKTLSADVEFIADCDPNTCELAYGAPDPKKKLCNRVGTLSFFLRGFPSFEVFVIDAKKMSILNLNTALLMMKAQFGSLQGLPALLTVSMETFTVGGKQQPAPILHLKLDPKVDYTQFGPARQLDAPESASLLGQDDEPPEEAAVEPDLGEVAEDEQDRAAAGMDDGAPTCNICGEPLTSAEVDQCTKLGVGPSHEACRKSGGSGDLPF
jgi:hypothetical protein